MQSECSQLSYSNLFCLLQNNNLTYLSHQNMIRNIKILSSVLYLILPVTRSTVVHTIFRTQPSAYLLVDRRSWWYSWCRQVAVSYTRAGWAVRPTTATHSSFCSRLGYRRTGSSAPPALVWVMCSVLTEYLQEKERFIEQSHAQILIKNED